MTNITGILKPVKGFTLAEAMVGLVISSVVITLIYYSFQIITVNFNQYKKKHELLNSVQQLNLQINHFCKWAHTVTYHDSVITFTRNNENRLLKLQNGTLISGVNDIHFDTLELNSVRFMVEKIPETFLINHFSLSTVINNQCIEFNYSKKYSSHELLLKH
ncbi:MAG: prepilin-type N-terminal cleavage/methylation domain-containing protein [Bacteroidia bacterium]